jgi:hypothetical protein
VNCPLDTDQIEHHTKESKVADNKAMVHAKTGSLVTAKGRILWHAVFKPKKAKGAPKDAVGKYEFNLLFPKDASHDALKSAAIEAGTEKFAKTFKDSPSGKWPSSIKSPFKRTADNDKLVAALEEAGLKVEDWPVFFGARSADKPGVVGPNGKAEGVDEEHVYSGRHAKMTMDAYAYDSNGNKGVTFGLKNIQLLDNDDELVVGGGRVSAESEFEAAEGAGDDSKSSDDVFA